jgi:hypothetical protein
LLVAASRGLLAKQDIAAEVDPSLFVCP